MGLGVGLAAILQGFTPFEDMFAPGLPGPTVFGLALIALAHLLAAIGAFLDLPLAWPVALVNTIGFWLTGAGMWFGGNPVMWHSNLWVWTILIYLLLRRRDGNAPWIFMTVGGLIPMIALMPRLDWRQQVLDISFTFVAIGIMALAYSTMKAQLQDLEDSVADDARRRSVEHRARLLESTRRENIRRVHDTLLHLFQQVASGRGEITREEVLRLGEESRAGLGTSDLDLEASPLLTALEQAVTDVGCPVALRIEDEASLPSKVTRNIAEATREAVRNVAKHVPGGTAQVTARTSSNGCTVVISDWGPGFDPSDVPRSRMGIKEGIHGRMAEVGGHATIHSDIVGGTAVTLTWNPIPHAVRIGPSGRRWLSMIALPSLFGTGLLLTLKDPSPNPVLAWTLFLATAAVVLLTSHVLRRRGLHIHEAILANAWGIGLLVANYAWLSQTAGGRYELWTIGLANALMIMTIPGRQWQEAASLVLANVTASVAGAAGLFGRVPEGTSTGTWGATVITGIVTLVLAVGASSIGKSAHQAQEKRTEEQLAEQLHNERAAEQQAWIAALDRICGPLFTGLYTGTVDPADPAVRVEARHVESRLRDALRLWPGGIHLATALDRLRRSGWGCLLDVEQVEAFEATRFAALLNQLDPAVKGQHLTITRRKGVLVATVAEPGLSETRQAGLAGARILLTDPDFTQFSCEEDQP
ncbi:ATP-binding protein [Arachnia propionica]|uniref:ATP-binding protein n=1 Tax=Arachnia propionica TaxID=1750 RepID=UPI0028D77230|nr:ATP-binding protein [Arachnia propionica]